MLIPFINAFRVEFVIILAATSVISMNNESKFSYSSAWNNNTAQGRLWNCSTTLGNPSGMHLVVVDGNRVQSSKPHGMIQSKCVPSGNNLTAAGTPLGMNLSNGSPMLGNSPSTKQPQT